MIIEFKKDKKVWEYFLSSFMVFIFGIIFYYSILLILLLLPINLFNNLEHFFKFWNLFIILIFSLIINIFFFFDIKIKQSCQRCWNKFYEDDLINITKKNVKDRDIDKATLICKKCLLEMQNEKIKSKKSKSFGHQNN